ncbi:MAG TPA: dienelactone hydrolase family protein [Kofleriaceae bacterium]|jgi:carboxymethylenebutenolidase
MPNSTIELTTPDGSCTTEVYAPDGKGPWPAVIVFFDAGGLRPAMSEICARIAQLGYLTFQPDLYFRSPPMASLAPELFKQWGGWLQVFKDPEMRAKFGSEYYGKAIDYDKLKMTVGALLDAIEARSDVRGGVGTTGYCMGGNCSFRAATLFPGRIAATACFHAGGLVTPQPDSPHLRAGQIKSAVYVAGATEDASFSDDAKAQLDAALSAAGVSHELETYPAKHGYAVRDHDVFDESAAQRHYAAMARFYGAHLGK